MLLTISIISGIGFLFYILTVSMNVKSDDTNLLTYGAILVISSWVQNTVVGITFLVVCAVLIIIALLIKISN
jgi:hypothetical protein